MLVQIQASKVEHSLPFGLPLKEFAIFFPDFETNDDKPLRLLPMEAASLFLPSFSHMSGRVALLRRLLAEPFLARPDRLAFSSRFGVLEVKMLGEDDIKNPVEGVGRPESCRRCMRSKLTDVETSVRGVSVNVGMAGAPESPKREA